MSVVRGFRGGEQVEDYGDDMALTRVTSSDARLARALEMYLLKAAGVPVKVIARKYRLVLGYAYQEIRSVPEWQRERLHVQRLGESA